MPENTLTTIAATSHFAQVNKIKLHYLDYRHEQDPTLILLHGLTANAHAFSGLIHAGLAAHLRIISPDLRGRGLSDKPAFSYTFADHANDVIGLMDELQITETYIGGHSFGGLLSAYLCVKYPKRFKKLILLDAAAALNPKAFDMLGSTLSRLDKTYPSYQNFMEQMKAAEQNTFWTDAMQEYYDADIRHLEDGSVTPYANLTNIYRAAYNVARQDWPRLFQKITQPTLLLNGVEQYTLGEPILPESKARKTVAMLPHGTYTKVAGNHHTMLYGEGAAEINREIIRFLIPEA